MPTEQFALLTTPLPGTKDLDLVEMMDFKGLAFVAMHGHDSLSRCFEFTISAVSGTPDIDANGLLGEEAGLVLQNDPDFPEPPRFFHGIVDRFRFSGANEDGNWLYELTLRPRLWLLGKTTDNRIFQQMTVIDIVSELLDQHGCPDYEWQLQRKPPPREYCVQYGESDLDFIQRLLEHDGIFYYFRFKQDKHILVLTDSLKNLVTASNYEYLPYRELRGGHASGQGVIARFSRIDSVVSASHSATDYDFEKPSADLMTRSENPLGHSNSEGARYSYPGNHIEHVHGDELSRIRNEEDQTHAQVITALSTAPGPAAGNIFTLRDFPRDSQNCPYAIERADYHILGPALRSRVALDHRGAVSWTENQTFLARDGGFSALYTLVPQSVHYRPQRTTPRPVMKGPQTAVVVGPVGEEIYTDKYSRVKVQFHWDRKGSRDENTSCFIRVSSAWAGSGWGFIQIPRIGQEVIVDFLEGDPDQPIITGRVYNAEQMPPYGLPGSATQSGWKSNSSPGGGGWNELRFEDKKGDEEVYFQAEKDHNELVKNNEFRHIGNDWSEEVVHDALQWVGHDRTETVDNNKSTTVGVDRSVSIGNNDDETVGSNRSLTVGSNETITVGSNSTESIGIDHSQSVGSNQSITVGMARVNTVGAAETHTVGAAQTISVGAARVLSVGAEQLHAIGADDGWTIGSSQSISVGSDRTLDVGKNSTVSVGENLTIGVGKEIVIDAGDSIILKCGNASIWMKKDGTIAIDGKDISIKGSGKVNVQASSDVNIKGSKINQN